MRNKKGIVLAAALTLMGSAIMGSTNVQAAQWNVNDQGWWYQEDDGGYPASEWKSINGYWYYFDANGYMVTNWQLIDGYWYYFYSDGSMAADTWIGNYYLQGNGTMATNTWIGNYYVDANGYMVTSWQSIDGYWYYFYSDGSMAANTWIGNYYLQGNGTMATNTWIGNYYVDANGVWVPEKVKTQGKWIQRGSLWKYRYVDGSYAKDGWKQIDGTWYLFDEYGYMLTGWQYVNDNWYYLQESGAMFGLGWHLIDGDWYYMYEDGSMAVNTWIGEYYVNYSGKMIDTSNGIYLLDVIKPYIKPYHYEDYSSKSFEMGGTSYTNGFTCFGYGDKDLGNLTYFNLNGKYREISFIAGITEQASDNVVKEVTFRVIADGKEVDNFTMKATDLPRSRTVSINNCKQLVISVYNGRSTAWNGGAYGLAEIKVKK